MGTVQDRSTLPLRSVLGVCHWQTAPEAAAEKQLRLSRPQSGNLETGAQPRFSRPVRQPIQKKEA